MEVGGMKRMISFFLVFVMLFCVMSIAVSASCFPKDVKPPADESDILPTYTCSLIDTVFMAVGIKNFRYDLRISLKRTIIFANNAN